MTFGHHFGLPDFAPRSRACSIPTYYPFADHRPFQFGVGGNDGRRDFAIANPKPPECINQLPRTAAESTKRS